MIDFYTDVMTHCEARLEQKYKEDQAATGRNLAERKKLVEMQHKNLLSSRKKLDIAAQSLLVRWKEQEKARSARDTEREQNRVLDQAHRETFKREVHDLDRAQSEADDDYHQRVLFTIRGFMHFFYPLHGGSDEVLIRASRLFCWWLFDGSIDRFRQPGVEMIAFAYTRVIARKDKLDRESVSNELIETIQMMSSKDFSVVASLVNEKRCGKHAVNIQKTLFDPREEKPRLRPIAETFAPIFNRRSRVFNDVLRNALKQVDVDRVMKVAEAVKAKVQRRDTKAFQALMDTREFQALIDDLVGA